MRPDAPNTPEIERSFLGGLILHPDMLQEFPDLSDSWFFDPKHQRIYKAIQNVSVAELPLNYDTLSIFLNGDSPSLGNILAAGALSTSMPAYAELLKRQARQREIIDRSALASLAASKGEYEEAENILSELYTTRPGHTNALTPTPVREAPGVQPTLFSHGPKRGGFGLIIAGDGVGKGWVILDLLLSCAMGKPINIRTVSHYGVPLRTVYFCYEDEVDIIKARLTAICTQAGIAPDTWCDLEAAGSLNFFCLPPELAVQRRMDLPQPTPTFDTLEQFLTTNNIDLCVIDPLSAAAGLQNEDNAGMNHFAKLVRSMAARTNCTSLLVHHTGKATRGALDHQASRGGSSLPGAARWVLNIAPDPDVDDDSRLIMGITKNSYGRRVYDIRLARGDDGVLRELTGEEIAGELVSLETALIQWLRDHPDVILTLGAVTLRRGDAAKLLLSEFADHPPAKIVQALKQALDNGTVAERIGKGKDRHPVKYLAPVKQQGYSPPAPRSVPDDSYQGDVFPPEYIEPEDDEEIPF